MIIYNEGSRETGFNKEIYQTAHEVRKDLPECDIPRLFRSPKYQDNHGGATRHTQRWVSEERRRACTVPPSEVQRLEEDNLPADD